MKNKNEHKQITGYESSTMTSNIKASISFPMRTKFSIERKSVFYIVQIESAQAYNINPVRCGKASYLAGWRVKAA